MDGVHARGRRAFPEPPREGRDRRGLAGGDDLDSAVGQVLDPAVELQTRSLLRCCGAVIDALDTARDDAANRLPAHVQLSPAFRTWVERSAVTARFFARTAFMRAGP
jgi:hypothetical protein